MKEFKKTTLLSTILFFVLSCNYFIPRDEVRTSTGEGYYSIERDTIVDSLGRGDGEVFATPSTALEFSPPVFNYSVNWNLLDYLLIADAFHKFQWRETTSDWNLNQIYTVMRCEDASEGPQFVFLWYFKNADLQNEKIRLVREIYIQPARNLIYWREFEYRPVNINWKSIELQNTKISYEDALRIAEENGGKQIRDDVNNECNVSIGLRPGSLYDDWVISYKYGLENTDIVVDTQTGQHKTYK